LTGISAFSHSERQDVLLPNSIFKEASDISDIFILLIEKFSSFLNYDIFETLQQKYVKDEGQEALKYPEHLKVYVEKHKIAEFVEIKGGLKGVSGPSTDTSEKMTLKIDIDVTCRLAKLKDLESALASILKASPLGLQLLDIEKGCVVVTFLVLNSIVNVIFNGDKDKILSPKQVKEFQAQSIRWLKCKEYVWDFGEGIVAIQGQANITGILYISSWLRMTNRPIGE
jgi:hypothetical protein